jgi:hypothetical protein
MEHRPMSKSTPHRRHISSGLQVAEWARKDMWTSLETASLLCGRLPDSQLADGEDLHQAGEQLKRAVTAGTLRSVGRTELFSNAPAAWDLFYGDLNFKPRDIFRWAGSKFPTLPRYISVGEAPFVSASAVYPQLNDGGAIRLVVGLSKQAVQSKRPRPLTDDDLEDLNAIWRTARLPPISLPMQEAEFEEYAEVFSSSGGALGWRLVPTVRNDAHNRDALRSALQIDHAKSLRAEIANGVIRPHHPLTRRPIDLVDGKYGDNSLIPIEQYMKFEKEMLGMKSGRARKSSSLDRKAAASKPLSNSERDTLQKQLGALALALAEKNKRYKRGSRPNANQIAMLARELVDALPNANRRGVSKDHLREAITAGLKLLVDD